MILALSRHKRGVDGGGVVEGIDRDVLWLFLTHVRDILLILILIYLHTKLI